MAIARRWLLRAFTLQGHTVKRNRRAQYATACRKGLIYIHDPILGSVNVGPQPKIHTLLPAIMKRTLSKKNYMYAKKNKTNHKYKKKKEHLSKNIEMSFCLIVILLKTRGAQK